MVGTSLRTLLFVVAIVNFYKTFNFNLSFFFILGLLCYLIFYFSWNVRKVL